MHSYMYHPYLIITGLSAPDEVHNSSVSNIRLVQGEFVNDHAMLMYIGNKSSIIDV